MFNFSELTSNDLQHVLDALDALEAMEALLVDNHVVTSGAELDLVELADSIVEEMTRRAMDEAGYKVNQMLARGELDRYVRPDGEIGYAPPGMMDEAQA